MRRFIIYILAVTAILVISWGCSEQQETLKPEWRSISESVYASVVIQPEGIYDLHAPTPGTIERITAEEGDRVKTGEVLVEIRAIDPKLNLESARLQFDLAQKQIRGEATALMTLSEEIELLKIQTRIDSQNFERQERLWEQQIGSRTTLENAELKYASSLRKLETLKTQYDLTKQELESAYERAEVGVRQAEALLEDYTITCRFDGCVYDILKNEGEQVLVQEPIARVGLCDSFVIEMMIDEVDIARVKKDQLVLVRLDAYSDQIFEARVQHIFPSKNMQTQTFTVEATFVQAPPTLYAGLAGEANVVIASKERAMTIPLEYLRNGNYVITERGEITVETGLRNLEFVEIINGIDTSTVLIKPALQ